MIRRREYEGTSMSRSYPFTECCPGFGIHSACCTWCKLSTIRFNTSIFLLAGLVDTLLALVTTGQLGLRGLSCFGVSRFCFVLFSILIFFECGGSQLLRAFGACKVYSCDGIRTGR